MPELAWRYGYPGALLLILAGVAVLHRLLRRAGWLREGDRIDSRHVVVVGRSAPGHLRVAGSSATMSAVVPAAPLGEGEP
jgi:hypothetical protein